MAEQGVGGPNYLSQLGRELSPGIDVFWTGPEIISREISVAHVRELQARLRRKPLLWDNLHANDYDGRRFFCGPYAGRPPGLPGEVSGILANPNTEFPLNYVPLRTLADYLRAGADWDPRRAYLEAMRLWWPRFATVGAPIEFEDLVRFGDCYYLPHEEGPEAEALYRQVRHLLAIPVERWGQATTAWLDQASRLRAVCGRLPELRCRPLFHALSRRVWELREELDLLEGFVRRRYQCPTAPCRSDFHLPDTYRGGLVARLQRLLEQRSDGTFIPAAVANADASEPQSISSL
jgi:protein O-GlcNAcase/histone acetyltransferase